MEQKNLFQRTAPMTLLALACTVLWGSAATVIKLGYAAMNIAEANTASQLLFAGCRFTLAGLMTLVFIALVRKQLPLPKKDGCVRRVGLLALTQTFAQYVCFYVGVAHTSGTNVAIISGTNAFATILVAALVFRTEKLNRYKVVGCLLGFFAVLLTNLSGLTQNIRFTLAGEGLVFGSIISCVLSANLIKRFSAEDDPVVLSGWQFTCGGMALALTGLTLGGKPDFGYSSAALPILLYLGFLSAFAYGVWSVLLKYNPVSRILVFNSLNPFFGVVFAALLLGETEQALRPSTLLALAMVSLGIFIVSRYGDRKSVKVN